MRLETRAGDFRRSDVGFKFLNTVNLPPSIGALRGFEGRFRVQGFVVYRV